MTDGAAASAPAVLPRVLRPAVAAAGVHIARVEIDKTGKITIITADGTGRVGEMTERNEWDAA